VSDLHGTPQVESGKASAGQPLPGRVSTGGDGSKEGHITRTGLLWAAVATSLTVMVVLIVFILQNQDYVQVRFLGLMGSVPVGVALVIAAVGGGVIVAISGAARIFQLRSTARRRRIMSQRGH
jgi:uncharacterized integral membrane protein